MEVELNEMRDKWQFKENEMIRLSHENTELEKKILQHNIEIDRLRHYESKEYHGTEGVVEKELENYKRLIESLTNKINVLESARNPKLSDNSHSHGASGHGHSHNNHDGHGHSHEHSSEHSVKTDEKEHNCQSDDSRKHLLEEIEMLNMEKSELLKAIQDFQMSKKSESPEKSPGDQEIMTNGTAEHSEMSDELLKKLSMPKSVTPSMATEEALEKLQSRFRRTMLEVADLTEEKQRLEHVVTQLQFETETIGEYITLYQYQRRLLKQKEHERDVQLKHLAADREKMNQKLMQLNGLIEKFVLQHTDSTELAQEAAKFLDQDKSSEPLIISAENRNEDILKLKQETAGKILEILSDIKTANSTSYETNVGVEHCSCCLGKLETV
jgi:golgin subfamily A member 2